MAPALLPLRAPVIGPVFNAVLVRRDAAPHFAASSAALPTSFAELLAEQRRQAAAPALRAIDTKHQRAERAATERAGSASPFRSDTFPEAAAPWLRTIARRELASTIHASAVHAGVDPDVAVAVAIAESSLEPTARSSDGLSAGTFQVTDATAAQIERHVERGVIDRPPGGDDVALGVAYLRYLDDLFTRGAALGRGLQARRVADPEERTRFAVAAFNAGEGRVAAAQRHAEARGLDATSFAEVQPFLPAITRRYVGRVTTYAGRDDVVGTQPT